MFSSKEILLLLERRLRGYVGVDGKIAFSDLESTITSAICEIETNEKNHAPIQKFLFVEDGSVDSDELEEILSEKNPEIKVVVYRQGASKPQLVDVTEVK